MNSYEQEELKQLAQRGIGHLTLLIRRVYSLLYWVLFCLILIVISQLAILIWK